MLRFSQWLKESSSEEFPFLRGEKSFIYAQVGLRVTRPIKVVAGPGAPRYVSDREAVRASPELTALRASNKTTRHAGGTQDHVVVGHDWIRQHRTGLQESAFDFVQSARTDSRFDYIARYVERETSTKAGRALTGGMWVRKVPHGWSYGFRSTTLPMETVPTSRDLYELILRSPLNYFVRKAEAFRADVLTESTKPPYGVPGSPERLRFIAWEHRETWMNKERKLAVIKSKLPKDVNWSRDWEPDTRVSSIRAAQDEIDYFKDREQQAIRSLTESSDTYQTFYHGTAAKNVPSILQKGLIPSFKAGAVPTKSLADDLERLDSVYLTRDIGTAHEYATKAAGTTDTPAVVRVRIPDPWVHRLITTDEYDHRGVRWVGSFPHTNLIDKVSESDLPS